MTIMPMGDELKWLLKQGMDIFLRVVIFLSKNTGTFTSHAVIV